MEWGSLTLAQVGLALFAAVPGMLCGGVAGSIVTAAVAQWRMRQQPVAYQIEVTPVLLKRPGDLPLRAVLVIDDGKNEHKFSNLALARITLRSDGNVDFSKFQFGVSLSGEGRILHVEAGGEDKYRRITVLGEAPAATSPSRDVTVLCEPLNRGDRVYLTLLIEIVDVVPDLLVGTSEPVALRRVQPLALLPLRLPWPG